MTAPPEKVVESDGFIVPSFEHGSLFLRGAGGALWRLAWEEVSGSDRAASSSPSRDRRRAVPAGSYELVGYRIVRRDAKGRTWHLAASSPTAIVHVAVPAGHTRRVDVRDRVHVECVARRKGGALRVGAAIRGIERCGISIYREGKKIPVRYEISRGRDEILARGSLKYG